MNGLMNAEDSIFGSLAECYMTIEGERYKFMSLISFESSWKVNIKKVPILGQVQKGNKATYAEGTWTGTAHYNQSVMRKLMKKYKDEKRMIYFDIQVTNEDPTSSIGRQTVILKNCLIEGGILAKFDADTEILEEELTGTFEDWEMPEEFTLIEGMQ